MSAYFDLVINCELRLDIPQDYIDALRYLASPEGAAPLPRKPATPLYGEHDDAFGFWDFFTGDADPFLALDPDNGVITNFYSITTFYKDMVVPNYHLQYIAHRILDDVFHDHLIFFYWLPTIAVDGFIGYHKEIYDPRPQLLYAKDGQCVDQNGNPLSNKRGPLLPDL